MVNAIWEAVKSGYESRDLEMVESACRHIRSLIPIDDDPTPTPACPSNAIPEQDSIRRRADIPEGFTHYERVEHFMEEFGLGVETDLYRMFLDFFKPYPDGALITRKAFCDYIAHVLPVSARSVIGSIRSLAAYNMASLTIERLRKNPQAIPSIVATSVEGGVTCCLSARANGHQSIDTLHLLSEAQQ
ncbi:MAG: hypothetical protein ACO3NK_03080 [Prochlorotrichaceae cyanobacterium]